MFWSDLVAKLPTEPSVWIAALGLFGVAFFLGYFWQDQSTRTRWQVKQEMLKNQQIIELEKVNQNLAAKNRELYAKELELTIANKHLQALEAAKSKFIAVTTHQLRTPLSAVKWTLDLAAKGQLGKVDEEQKSFLNKGLISVNRVIAIVNELLRVDSVETDQVVYCFQPVNFIKLFDEVLFEFEVQAKSKGVKLSVRRPETDLPPIDLDETKIKMVMENLFDNAIKYTPVGGLVEVVVSDKRLNRAEGAIEVTVRDSGIGIPSEEKNNIFQKFFRATNAIKAEPDGSGLGLFIAHDIVTRHNGSMWFEPAAGGGTIFTFTLPIHQKTL
ncbi:MAG: hypothetical protein COV08_01065 [Candidatus Vogelbacteria bacterium CG10_big_fil_rev_8_21_14_0_10_49_38]|uniref:histidine kinase n=1 Tax=Candidatus Vogelbacteria bacterium CG10_big_fil_rev_8_21_14_0_10_49_38 TaxID=1975043 RepID=A0A2H0RJL2_9BACT|nr:MAG: hypothetical protein BK006_01075 [bacterium CG10_49_38]PIR46194.1 MAG: hypothetical protein COV08_01065 [Candidatus Vogelbacteria bacterium CG10_big_fil_rev_8_21_14_0_10_49_38]